METKEAPRTWNLGLTNSLKMYTIILLKHLYLLLIAVFLKD